MAHETNRFVDGVRDVDFACAFNEDVGAIA